MSTNEFWADGMRVGKAVGFKNGIEAAAKWLRGNADTRWHREVLADKMIRALSRPREPTPSHAAAPDPNKENP